MELTIIMQTVFRERRWSLLPVPLLRNLCVCLFGMLPFAAVASADPRSMDSDLAMAGQALSDNKIDRILKEWDTPSGPGASVAVIDKGKLVFAKGYGIANLEYGIPITPGTVFHVASVSKQFTAMAAVLLESDGKLSINDDIHKYLPELPDYGYKITIRNLLNHTSGVRDQWQTLGLAGWSMEDVITQDQILRLLFRQKELNFPPGTRFLYSNGGFTLLAEIVTRVSGKAFAEFCAERIFGPLQMRHTHFHQDLTRLVPGRAYSYSKNEGGYAAEPLNYANVGATSLFTTADDLARWLDNFRDPKVGGAAGVARLQERGILSDGTKIGYGLGLEIGTYRGLKTVSHEGGDAGYRSDVLWFPEQQLGVAVLSNLADFNPSRIAKAVASVYIGDTMAEHEPEPLSEPVYLAIQPKKLEQFVGVYPLPKIDQIFSAVVEHGKLWSTDEIRAPLELRPVGAAHFYIKELHADIEFSPRANGGMSVKISRPDAINESERIASAAAAVARDFLPYTGVYWSEELETQYTFFLRGGVLFGRHAHHGEFALVPTTRDRFTSGQWFAPRIGFFRNSAGRIAGVTLGGGRVIGITFVRKAGGLIKEASRTSAQTSRAAAYDDSPRSFADMHLNHPPEK